MTQKTAEIEISKIKIGKRHRKDLGDIDSLAKSIAELGLLQAVVLDRDLRLLGGLRRIKAAQKLGWKRIRYQIADKVADAIKTLTAERDENTCRKSFAPTEALAIGQTIESKLRGEAKQRQATSTGGKKPKLKPASEKFTEADKGDTRDKVAATVGMSGVTYEKVKTVVAAAKSDLSLKPVVEQMDKDGKVDKALRAVRRKQAVQKVANAPSKKYRVLYADPPWKYSDSREALDGTTGASSHYPTMSIKELCDLPVQEWCDENAVLFLWVTSPLLFECAPVIKDWGFTYKSSFVWDKVKHNMGHYNSVRHEFLLVCTRGSCVPDVAKLFDSVQTVERSDRHSEKPEIFREIIDTLYPHGKRLEMFARTKVKNWDTYGTF